MLSLPQRKIRTSTEISRGWTAGDHSDYGRERYPYGAVADSGRAGVFAASVALAQVLDQVKVAVFSWLRIV
jgi:hypothetical protein